MSSNPLVREPQQERSRVSFDRAVDAAVELLAERGSASFTVLDVSRASGVSTGSIYGRVASKDDLLRVAHAREMQRLTIETAQAFAAAPTGGPLVEVVEFSVRAMADLLDRNAKVLKPFMRLADRDQVIASNGQHAFEELTTRFEAALRSADGVRGGARGRRAAAWSCTVAYSVLARQLALGSDPGAAADYSLGKVIKELSVMITAYMANA